MAVVSLLDGRDQLVSYLAVKRRSFTFAPGAKSQDCDYSHHVRHPMRVKKTQGSARPVRKPRGVCDERKALGEFCQRTN
jgi:hypothetical protein